MIALHAVVPLAIVVRAPFSYAGSLFLATGTAMIIWSRRAFQAAGTPIIPFTESTESSYRLFEARFGNHSDVYV